MTDASDILSQYAPPRREPELRNAPLPLRDRLVGGAQDAWSSFLNRIAPAMYAEQNRPVIEGILGAIGPDYYQPGERESENVEIHPSKEISPEAARAYYRYHAYGELPYETQTNNMLPEPRASGGAVDDGTADDILGQYAAPDADPPRRLGSEDFIEAQLGRQPLNYPKSAHHWEGGPNLQHERMQAFFGIGPEQQAMSQGEFFLKTLRDFAHEAPRLAVPGYAAGEDAYRAYQRGDNLAAAGNAAVGIGEVALPFAMGKIVSDLGGYTAPDNLRQWLARAVGAGFSAALPTGTKASKRVVDNVMAKEAEWSPSSGEHWPSAGVPRRDKLSDMSPLERPLEGMRLHDNPVDVYHGTRADFEKFDKAKSNDFGIHAGTPDQATDFTSQYGAGRILPIKLGPKDRPFTSLEVSDLGSWQPVKFMRELEQRGVRFTDDEAKSIATASSKKEAYPVIEAALNKHGVDLLRYKNMAEGEKPDTSWITWNPETMYSRTTGSQLYGLGAPAGAAAILNQYYGDSERTP